MHSPIDPSIARFLAEVLAGSEAFSTAGGMPPAAMRQMVDEKRMRWREGGPTMARIDNHVVETASGPLAIRVYRPAQAPLRLAPALIYLHGGGFVFFSVDTHDRLMREYADAGGFVVIGVDYPRSPEARYPVALDHLVAFAGMLPDLAAQWGVDASRMAIGGDSAGANLAMATCLRLRDAGAPVMPRALLSNYGAFAGHVSDQAEADHGGEGAILTRDEMAWYFSQYLDASNDRHDRYAEPLYAPDLRRLPPTLFIVPDRDVLTEQSVALADRMLRAGNETCVELFAGATHSFLEAMSISAIARRAIALSAQWLADRLAARETDRRNMPA